MGNQTTSGNADGPNYRPGLPFVHPTTERPSTSQSFCVAPHQKMIITNTPHDKLYGFHSTTVKAGDNNLPKRAKRERSGENGKFMPVWNTTNTNIEDEDKTFDLSSKLSVLVTSATDSSGEVPKVVGGASEYLLSKEDILKEEPCMKRMDNWKKVKLQLETRSGPGVPNHEKTSPGGSASRIAKCEAVQSSPAKNERARKDLVEDESYVKFVGGERRQTPILNDTGGGRENNKCNDGAPTLFNNTSNHYDVSKDVESTRPTAADQGGSPSRGNTESRSLGSYPGVYLPNDVNQGVQDQTETNVHYTPNQEHTNLSTFTNTDLENVKAEDVNVDTSVQNFREVVENKKRFVDKTLLIKVFVDKRSRVQVITAPSSFGKSTVVDMFKKFFEVAVDSQGTPIKPTETTDNYHLFCNPQLNICKNKKFVEAHLGKYPVIHINYNKLKDVKDFPSLLTGLQQVICDSFEQHKYLQHNMKLFMTSVEKDYFVDCCNRHGVLKLTKYDIRRAFEWLSKLLFEHFRRLVIILLDECDAYIANMLNRSMSDVDEIVDFLSNMHSDMFKYNEYFRTALLTGILFLHRDVWLSTLLIDYYRFLENHDYSSYYGFTRQEVQQLLEKNAQNNTDMTKVLDEIDNYYNGYNVQGRDTILYSPSSILSFLHYDMTLGNYWIKNHYNKKVFDIIKKNKLLAKAVKKLVLEDIPLLGHISRPCKKDLMLILDENTEFLERQKERLASFLFDIGYVMPEGAIKHYLEYTTFNIPNKEIYLAFCKFLNESYIKAYKYSQDWQDALCKAVESFKPDESNMERYKSFYQAAQNYIISSTYYPHSKTDFKLVFFVPSASWDMQVGNTIATEKFTYVLKHDVNKFASLKTQTELFWKKKKKTNNEKTVRMDVILVNGEKTLIVFQIKINKVSKDKETTLDKLNDLAKKGLVQILEVYDSYLNNNEYIAIRNRNTPTRGRIYIGLAYDISTRQMSMSFYQPSVDEVPVFHNSSNVHQDYEHIS